MTGPYRAIPDPRKRVVAVCAWCKHRTEHGVCTARLYRDVDPQDGYVICGARECGKANPHGACTDYAPTLLTRILRRK